MTPTVSTSTPKTISEEITQQTITWEAVPWNYPFAEIIVDNTDQPLLASALRESLALGGFIEPPKLIATDLRITVMVDGEVLFKAPDWVYIAKVKDSQQTSRRSYTPYAEGEAPLIVMEFISATDGGEYQEAPWGKWFFYEQILKVPTYIIFDPNGGLLEVYRLHQGKYQLENPNLEGRHWLEELNLFLGTWRGTKDDRAGYWLRWWDAQENMLPWAKEQVEAEQARAEMERLRAEQEKFQKEQERARADAEQARAEKLANYLRSMGINPENIT